MVDASVFGSSEWGNAAIVDTYKKVLPLHLGLRYGSPHSITGKIFAIMSWLSGDVYTFETGAQRLVDEVRSPIFLPRATVQKGWDLGAWKRGMACIE